MSAVRTRHRPPPFAPKSLWAGFGWQAATFLKICRNDCVAPGSFAGWLAQNRESWRHHTVFFFGFCRNFPVALRGKWTGLRWKNAVDRRNCSGTSSVVPITEKIGTYSLRYCLSRFSGSANIEHPRQARNWALVTEKPPKRSRARNENIDSRPYGTVWSGHHTVSYGKVFWY